MSTAREPLPLVVMIGPLHVLTKFIIISSLKAEQELTRALNESGMKDQLKARMIENLNDAGWRDQV